MHERFVMKYAELYLVSMLVRAIAVLTAFVPISWSADKGEPAVAFYSVVRAILTWSRGVFGGATATRREKADATAPSDKKPKTYSHVTVPARIRQHDGGVGADDLRSERPDRSPRGLDEPGRFCTIHL